MNNRQASAVSVLKTLPAYSGWEDDEILTNITDVLSSGDSTRISGLTNAVSGIDNYSGWQPDEITGNLKDVFAIQPSLLERGKELVGDVAGAVGGVAQKGVEVAKDLAGQLNKPEEIPERDMSVGAIEDTLKPQPMAADVTATDTRLPMKEESVETTIGPTMGETEQKKEEGFAVPSSTMTVTEPEEIREKKLMAQAESESAWEAGLKEAGLTLTFSESPVTPYRTLEHPSVIPVKIGTAIGETLLTGAAASKLMLKIPKLAALSRLTTVTKVGKTIKTGKAAFDSITRMTAVGLNDIARNKKELFSEDPEVRNKAIKNTAINIAAAGASSSPEQFLPSGLLQPIAQGATDLFVETVGQAVAGDNAFNKENLANTLASTLMGTIFGVADIKGVDDQSKSVINTMKSATENAKPDSPKIKPIDAVVSKERRDQIYELVRKDIEKHQTPSESRVIEPESTEFESVTGEQAPSGVEAIRNVRKPPTETDLKLTVPEKAEVRSDTENIERLPSEERIGEEPFETEFNQGTGGEKVEADRVFQKEEIGDKIIQFKSKDMKTADEKMDARLGEVRSEEKKAAEAGFLKLPGEEKPPEGGVKKVSETLEAGRFTPLSAPAKIAQSINGTIGSIKENFTKYEMKLDEFPQYKDNKRTQFVKMRRVFYNKVAKYRHASLGKVMGSDGNAGIRKATDILLLRNLKLRGQKGQTLENNLTVEEVSKHLDWLEKNSSPQVLEAADDMRTIMRGLGEELVARGKLTAESLEEDYFPHKVLEYLPDFMHKMATPMNRKFGEPYRPYTKQAIGSKRLIASDDSVVWTHIAKVLADNTQEDWFTKQALKYDAMNKITPEQKKKLYKGAEVDIDGKKYKALEWKKVRYRTKALNEDMLEAAVQNDMLVKDWLATKGPRGGEPVREVTVTGKPQLYLLPKEIAQDLDNMIEKSPAVFDLIYRAGKITQQWKALTLQTAFLPYQVGNALGDSINVAVFDPFAFKYLPKATRVASKMFYPDGIGKKIKLTESEQKLYDVAIDKDVASSGMTAELRMGPVKGLLEKYNTASEYRESLMRLSVLAHQLDRVKQGKNVQNLAGIDLEGLDPESSAGKVSREVLVDYLSIPRSYQLFLSRGLMPFVRFHEGNFRNYARAISKNKGTHKAISTLAPIVSAYAAQWAYNNLNEDRKELEMQLPDYMRERFHIVLGKDEEGNVKVWAPQQPVDMAMSWLGIDKMNRIASDLNAKKITAKEAAIEFLGGAVKAPAENAQTLLNPFIQMWQGLISNRDPFTKRRIMPDRVHKQGVFSRYGRKYALGYMVEKVITPVAQYTRTKRGNDPMEHPILNYLKNGPVNVPRAFGFYDINPMTKDLSEHHKTAGPIDAAKEYYRTKFYDIIDEYGEDVTNGMIASQNKTPLTENQLEAINKVDRLSGIAKDNGFTGLNYGTWLKSPDAQRKIIDAELRKTTDREKRRALFEKRKKLITASQAQYMKQVPKEGRRRYQEEIGRRGAILK